MLQKIRNFPYYARKAYREGLGWASAPQPTWLQRAARGPLSQAQRWQARLGAKPSRCVWRLTGQSAAGDELLRVVLLVDWPVGQEPALDYYERLLFHPGSIVRQNLGAFQGSLRRKAESLVDDADLILVASAPGSLWQPPAGNWRLGPSSLRLVVNLPQKTTWDGFLAQRTPDPLIDRVRESGWSAYQSHRRGDFNRFYHQIYRPTLETHPAAFIQPLSETEMQALYNEHPQVMLIEGPGETPTSGELVAGALSFPWRGAIRTWANGVWQGSQALLDQGALAACDYFSLQHAIKDGYAQYEAGPCLPFVSDARFTQLQAWGAETIQNPWQNAVLLVWAPASSRSGSAWLRANPFQPGVGRSGGELANEAAPPRPARRAAAPRASSAGLIPQTGTAAYHFEAYSSLDDATRGIIRHGLYDHAVKSIGPEINQVHQSFAITVQDEKGEVIGGLLGAITWNYLHIDSLWVSSQHRGHDLGTRLLKIAEDTARAEGLEFITLETTSFEAINFYPRFGYEVVGQVEGIPPGHTLYYLKKRL